MKKILCIILSTVLIATASFNVLAVSDNTVDTITDLGIMIGDENGNLNLDENITRAEFTTIVLRMLGLADSGSNAVTSFADVPATHWASGAINLAAQLKIVNGYGDGNFGPEDTVTYEQATKMIVAALGYTPMAESNGGYPGGYQVVASQKGLFNEVTGISMVAPAVRGNIATMIVNALTVPLMEQTGYGTETKFETVSTHLLDKLGISKYEGVVVGTSATGDTKEGKVEVNYNYEICAIAGKVNAQKVVPNISTDTIYATGNIEAKAKDLVDIAAILYVKDANTDNAELICIVKDGNKNTTVSFMSEDIKEYANNTVKVYTGIDEGEYEEYDLNINKVYVNGRVVDDPTIINSYLDNSLAIDITLLSQVEDEFNVAYITEYVDVKVENISARNYKIYTDNGSYTLDETDKNQSFTIYKNGKVASFDDIAVNDILSIAGYAPDGILEYGEVYIVTDTIEGIVTGKYANGDIKVDGKTYKTNGLSVNIGDSYIFYTNVRGILVGLDKTTSAANLNYAYASWIYRNMDFGDSKIRVLTSDNTWVTYDFADRVRYNGTKIDAEDIADDDDFTNITGTSRYTVNGVIAYELDSNDKIDVIYTSEVAGEFEDTGFVANSSAEYFAATGMLGGYDVDNTTVIFSINDSYVVTDGIEIDEDKITVVSTNTLTDRYTYDIINGYNADEDTNVWAVLVGKDVAPGIDWTSNFFVVCEDPMETVNDKDEEGISLTGLQNGEKVTIFINDDTSNITKASWVTSIEDFAKGDIVIYNLDNSGEVAEIKILFDASKALDAEKDDTLASALVSTTNGNIDSVTVGTTTYDFIYGYATDRKNTNITIGGNIYKFNVNTIGTVYDHFTNDKVSEAGYGDIVYDSNSEKDGDFVFARISNNVIVEDFVIISNDR